MAMATKRTKKVIPEPQPTNGQEAPQPNLFNLTFKSKDGTSVVSVPEEQIHHMAQAIHHFFKERNINSTFNFTPANGEQGKQAPEGS